MATKKNSRPAEQNPAENKKTDETPDITPAAEAGAAPNENRESPAAEENSAATAPFRTFEAEYSAEHERLLRLAAEYDNFRKRSQKEREALFSDIRGETILKFLPVYDNLARALRHETADTAFKKGVEMTMAQLQEILEKLGVTEIPAEGNVFDPVRHNAVMHIEDENFGQNIIAEEFEKGFMLGDKVIRCSMVKVAN